MEAIMKLDDRKLSYHNFLYDLPNGVKYFFMVERVKKHEFKYKLSSEIICVGTIPEPTSELNNLELQKSTHHQQ